MWAQWIKENPGPGSALRSAVTASPVLAQSAMPIVNIPIMPAGTGGCPEGQNTCDNTAVNQSAIDFYKQTPGDKFWAYNDGRPATGSSMTEDDGIAMRVLGWTQYKKGVDRWFYWYVNPDGAQNFFQNAVTFGSIDHFDAANGQAGYAMSNGNGLLSYPGTDLFNPSDSYGIDGPIASLRLKEWRRGLQDGDYLTIAAKIDPVAVQRIVSRVLPKTLWEYTANDPSFYNGGGPSWSSDPDSWEEARAELAEIITAACESKNPAIPQPTCTAAGNQEPGQVEATGDSAPGSLTVESHTPGVHWYTFGTGCRTGFWEAGQILHVTPGSLCLVAVSIPDGFSFLGWSDNSHQNVRTIVVPTSTSTRLVANFGPAAPETVAVTITSSLANSSVTVSGSSCPAGKFDLPVTLALAPGLSCTLQAAGMNGYSFTHWSTGAITNPTVVIVPDHAVSYNATFEAPQVSTPGLTAITLTSNVPHSLFYVFGSGCASAGILSSPATLGVAPGKLCLISAFTQDERIFKTWNDGTVANPKSIIVGNQAIVYEATFQ